MQETKIKPIISRYANKNWRAVNTSTLPEWIYKKLLDADAFRGRGVWFQGTVFETTDSTKFMVVFDNGWYYKVGAEFALWYVNESGNVVLQCCWSATHLKRTMRSIIETGKPIMDPGYTT